MGIPSHGQEPLTSHRFFRQGFQAKAPQEKESGIQAANARSRRRGLIESVSGVFYHT